MNKKNGDNTMNPMVSVIIATYRRSLELKRAIQSVINQTYQNVEIIVIDDNANEQWNSIVSDIINLLLNKTSMSIKKIVNASNLGSAKTRNRGIEESTGDYITFLDDDDYYLPEKIEKQLFAMINSNADYSISDLTLLYSDGSICEERNRPYLLTKERSNLIICHLKYHMTGTDTLMFSKEYLNKIGRFEPIDVGDEFYLMMKAINGDGVFVYQPGALVCAYVHTGDNSLSSGLTKINGENALFKYKKTFFHSISKRDQQYIIMRHHAVLSFAYKRNGNYLYFFLEGVLSFLAEPIACFELIQSFK